MSSEYMSGQGVATRSSIRTLGTREGFLSSMGAHMSGEVVDLYSAVRTESTGVRFVARMYLNVFFYICY